MNRAEILDRAKAAVCGRRETDYGSPERNFEVIADLWLAYLEAREGCIKPHDVAAMMILLKVGRISSGKMNMDNWIDAAGYAACGAELEEWEAQEK